MAPPAGRADTSGDVAWSGSAIAADQAERNGYSAHDAASVGLERTQLLSRAELATRRHDDGIRVEERLRIAQDLHDGTQQQLVAILIEVELAKGKSLDPGVQSLLATLSARVNEVIDSIRELASHGAPALLEERGLEEALVAAAERMPVPTVVRCRGVARYTPEVEKAVYFSCLEAMQNAEKHADEAAHVTVELAERDSELRFVVTDDGCGFDAYATPAGAGLTNITARMYAVGGGSAIDSRRGCGSTVMGWAFV